MKKIVLSILVLLPLVACENQATSSVISSNAPSEISSVIPSSVLSSDVSSETPSSNLIVPVITNLKAEPQGHFSQVQLNYLSNNDYSDTTPYNGNLSVCKPLPVSISWECNEEGPYQVEIITGRDLIRAVAVDSMVYEVNEPHFDFYNPLFNEQYFVSVKKGEISETTTFKVEPTVSGPRNLYVDGVENFRDIGGWGKFVDDKYQTFMKQGMVYRSGRFNEDKADPINVTISESGLYEIKNNLKIKTEIDLRRTSTNEVGSLTDKSVLGDDVKYVQLPMAYGGNNILTFKGKLSNDTYEYDNPAMIKSFFEILADKNNYPINYHCSIGKDRTGCMSYLIEGLLGFDQEIMYRDYMFTNFADAGMCKMTDVTNRYGSTLDKYENGENIQEKVYNYLNEVIGVSKENLDKIINILKA